MTKTKIATKELDAACKLRANLPNVDLCVVDKRRGRSRRSERDEKSSRLENQSGMPGNIPSAHLIQSTSERVDENALIETKLPKEEFDLFNENSAGSFNTITNLEERYTDEPLILLASLRIGSDVDDSSKTELDSSRFEDNTAAGQNEFRSHSADTMVASPLHRSHVYTLPVELKHYFKIPTRIENAVKDHSRSRIGLLFEQASNIFSSKEAACESPSPSFIDERDSAVHPLVPGWNLSTYAKDVLASHVCSILKRGSIHVECETPIASQERRDEEIVEQKERTRGRCAKRLRLGNEPYETIEVQLVPSMMSMPYT